MTRPYYQIHNDLTAQIAAMQLRLDDAAAWAGFYRRMRGSRYVSDCGQKMERADDEAEVAGFRLGLLWRKLDELEAGHRAAVRARIGAHKAI